MNDASARHRALVLDPSDPMRSRAVVRHRSARREDLDGAASGAAVIATSSGTTTPEREWWRREAARLGSDWNAIMQLRALVAPLTCGICGAAPCVNPSFCAACRIAGSKGRGWHSGKLGTGRALRPQSKRFCIASVCVGKTHYRSRRTLNDLADVMPPRLPKSTRAWRNSDGVADEP
jgi:hypothetical protein